MWAPWCVSHTSVFLSLLHCSSSAPAPLHSPAPSPENSGKDTESNHRKLATTWWGNFNICQSKDTFSSGFGWDQVRVKTLVCHEHSLYYWGVNKQDLSQWSLCAGCGGHRGGAVSGIVFSQQQEPGFGLSVFDMFSPCLLPQSQDLKVRLIGDLKLSIGLNLNVWLFVSICQPCNELPTSPGCTSPKSSDTVMYKLLLLNSECCVAVQKT